MGYNLHLFCRGCRERAYCSRGHESASIALFAKRHPGHNLDCGIDNGFAERRWIDPTESEWSGGDLYLPDDLVEAQS